MVLPILIAIVSAPALLGTQEAIRQSQSKEKREEHRARRCNLVASCVKSSLRSREINGRPIVLKDGKLWIDTGTSNGAPFGHQYAGYYLPYPDTKYEGLVTTITDVAPIMNWVYIDKDTYEVKYGVRLDAQPNITGPFDCTRQDRRLTFDGWEGWCAVEEFPTLWALYFDKDDDGLQSKVAPGTRVLEVELTRKEKRWKKDGEERQQDQTTKRAVETKEDAPVDNPITAQPELNPPGVGVPNEEKAPEPLKPFGLPKSIFSDPPRPLFFGQEFLPPRTPPPAYAYEMDAPVAPPPVENIVLSAPEPEAPQPVVKTTPVVNRAQTPPQTTRQAPRNASPPRRRMQIPERDPATFAPQDALRLAKQPQEPVPANIAPTNETVQTPERAPASSLSRVDPKTPPLAPAPLRVTPPTDRRPTPKLNRNSGTRTLAQAQMFESWALRQSPMTEPASKSNRPPSRPLSTATSGSDYSNPTRFGEDDVFTIYEQPKASLLPSATGPKLEKAQQEPGAPPIASDPAVFARFSSGSSTTSDPAVVKDKPVAQTSIRRKGSFASAPATAAPKAPLPPLPGVFSENNQRRNSPGPSVSRPEPLSRRQPSTSGRNRAISPEQQRRQSPSTSRDPPRNTTRNPIKPPGSRESPIPRQRNGSASSQSQNESARPSPRPSIARTNTAPVRDRGDRSRTTSNLYREIDDLVSTGRNRSGSAASTSSTRRNDLKAEDRQPTLRRTMTAREPRKNESLKSTADRPRDAGVRPPRRGERDGTERRY
ncbi:hypothetical protein N0V90_007454 [Kalmusia sp. IMI 367209]|nr:hypothetical protein N0V90_007454 [Kalmusia sp. IMI 367209]